MQMMICKRFRFEAAHHLPNHNGKCRRPHGHSYILDVTVEGPVRPIRHGVYGSQADSSEGMVIDFGDLSAIVRERIIDVCDHQNLNEVLALEAPVTTAECLAYWAFNRIQHGLADVYNSVTLVKVRMWETADAFAEYHNPDRIPAP